MEIKNNIISMDKYRYYVFNVGWIGFENVVEKLKGKKIVDDYETIDDCGVYYVSNLLDCDWGRSIVYNYSKIEIDFINSQYLSDYFIDNIRELLCDNMTKNIEDILNSDKEINQMNEEEIKIVYDAIVEYYHINKTSLKSNLSGRFLTYLYKLNGKGVSMFIKNNIAGEKIARQLLLTSGLNDRASFYSGRGVIYSDLSEENLVAIFEKLIRLDIKYALSFIEMVCDMKTLGATEFISSFILLGTNNFKYENVRDNNVSFDDFYGSMRDRVAMMSIFSVVNRKDDNYQISMSNKVKKNFLFKIRKILEVIHEENLDALYKIIEEKEFIYDDTDYRRYCYRRR